MKMRFLVLFIIGMSAFQLRAQERIEQFVSDITVNRNGMVDVTETITVVAQSIAIKRGIVREIPTRYHDRWGNNMVVSLRVKEVLRDGSPEPYFIKDAVNGVRIFIGSSNKYLRARKYRYTISYTVNRVLGFFKDHDELYWNVTGSGWQFPIEQCIARVTLPGSIAPSEFKTEAYTGAQDQQGRDYTVQILPDHRIEFVSMRPLQSGEGLTLIVGWPKNFIMPPSFIQESYYFIRDNLGFVWIWIGVLLMLFWYTILYIRWRVRQRLSTIIPLFYPPAGLTPGAVRYIDHLKYDAKVLAADVMNLAVQGMLTIEYRKKFLGHEYILHAIKKPDEDAQIDDLDPVYKKLSEKLFKNESTLVISHAPNRALMDAASCLQGIYAQSYSTYFEKFHPVVPWLMIVSAFFFIPAIWAGSSFALLGVALLFGMFLFFTGITQGYTAAGKKIKEQIQGFKMYLQTAETERFKIIGTPPTKTPQLYEHYLPYAVALGCEEQWTSQFAPLFKQWAAQGISYHPSWYSGGPHFVFVPEKFASSFASDVRYAQSTPISSSNRAPGSSSGFGGRGSSGGGSGGGGGGGW